MRKFKTMAGLSKSAATVSLRVITSKQAYFSEWEKFKISPELEAQIIEDVAAVLGGNKKEALKDGLARAIRYGNYHWALERIQYDRGRWSYCAGQDYTAELNAIRAWLYRL